MVLKDLSFQRVQLYKLKRNILENTRIHITVSKLKYSIIRYDTASSSSYSIYPTQKRLWSGFGEGRKTATHTRKGECGQRVPRLEKGLPRERPATTQKPATYEQQTLVL